MVKTCNLRCRLRRGMFPDEFIAKIVTVGADGQRHDAQTIVYKTSVAPDSPPTEAQEVSGKLRVYCVQRKGELAAVVLPQATLQNGPSVVVPVSDLE